MKLGEAIIQALKVMGYHATSITQYADKQSYIDLDTRLGSDLVRVEQALNDILLQHGYKCEIQANHIWITPKTNRKMSNKRSYYCGGCGKEYPDYPRGLSDLGSCTYCACPEFSTSKEFVDAVIRENGPLPEFTERQWERERLSGHRGPRLVG